MRHELSPMFTSLRLKIVTELMNGNATELVQKIKRDHIDNNETVNLKVSCKENFKSYVYAEHSSYCQLVSDSRENNILDVERHIEAAFISKYSLPIP